jgi:hypothetical protein
MVLRRIAFCLSRSLKVFATGAVIVMAMLNVAHAELPSIRFDRIAPLGANAGTTVEVEIAGADIEELERLYFDHPGITSEAIPDKEKWFRVTVAPDVPSGTYDVLLIGRWGVSNPRLFAVTEHLTDVTEMEPNSETPQTVSVNSAIAGMSDGNGEDVFAFKLTAGQWVVLDCQAGMLDSGLDATMSLYETTLEGQTKKLVASSSDYHGRDPLIDWTAASDGDYQVIVHDLSYRGGLPYRLLITDRPRLEQVFPRAVQAGTTAELVALGQNLGADARQSTLRIGERSLVELSFQTAVPKELFERGEFPFYLHPTNHSVAPTAATCTLTGMQVRPVVRLSGRDAPMIPLNSPTVVVCDCPVTVESQDNDQVESAQPIQLPLVLSGRFENPGDADWFEFEVPQAGQYAVEVFCERIAGVADPYVLIVDDAGTRVNELDDFGHRINAFDGHLRDPVGMVQLAEKRKYRILVQDRYRRGGARYQYVLTIHWPQPDFYPAVIHSQNPGPGGTNLWRGGAVYLDTVIHQTDGFSGEITLTCEGLPPGVHAMPTVINNNSRGVLVLWADDDAPKFTGPIQVFAEGKRDEQVLRRGVRAYARLDSGTGSSQPLRQLMLAVRDEAPYRLQWPAQQVQAEAGKTVDIKLQLVRRQANWKSEVTIQSLAFPGNFQMANTSFVGDVTEITIPIAVQAGTRAGDYTLAVLGQSQVPFNKDAAATDRPNTLVSLPSQPITITVSAPQ